MLFYQGFHSYWNSCATRAPRAYLISLLGRALFRARRYPRFPLAVDVAPPSTREAHGARPSPLNFHVRTQINESTHTRLVALFPDTLNLSSGSGINCVSVFGESAENYKVAYEWCGS